MGTASRLAKPQRADNVLHNFAESEESVLRQAGLEDVLVSAVQPFYDDSTAESLCESKPIPF